MPEKPSRARAVRYRDEAIRSLDEDRPEDALALLWYAFEHDPGFRSVYEVAIDALETLGHYDESTLFQNALEAFGESRSFYHLGYHYFDRGQTRLAIPFLRRAASLQAEHADTLIALAISLSAEGLFAQAQKALEAHPELETQFWPYHEYAYNHLLLGQPARARKALARIRKRIDTFRATVADDELVDFESAVDRLEGGVLRYERLEGRIVRPLRDWHFIQYGAQILETCDERFGSQAPTWASGRFVALWSTPGLVHGVLARLALALGDLPVRLRRIVPGPDPESEVLAAALARLLELPVEPFGKDGSPEEALVVVATSEELQDLPEAAERAPGQVVFTYAVDWTRDCAFVPDVAGLLAQHHVFPWQDPLPTDAELAYDLPADPRPIDEIASWVLEAGPAPPPLRWDEDRAFYRNHARDLTIDDWLRHPRRDRFLTNSPVPGWRLA